MNTGSVRPRNGPVVTAGGLVFVANSQDRMLRAYDKANGRVLWEHELEANPEGIPAVYEVRGRQYIAFAAGASWGTGGDPVWRNAVPPESREIEAQGYHVFALPRDATIVARDCSRQLRGEDAEASGSYLDVTKRSITMRPTVFDGSCIATMCRLASACAPRQTPPAAAAEACVRARARRARARHLAHAHAGRRRPR